MMSAAEELKPLFVCCARCAAPNGTSNRLCERCDGIEAIVQSAALLLGSCGQRVASRALLCAKGLDRKLSLLIADDTEIGACLRYAHACGADDSALLDCRAALRVAIRALKARLGT
jgi:hypothetical protein